jgi:hypothetical protein
MTPCHQPHRSISPLAYALDRRGSSIQAGHLFNSFSGEHFSVVQPLPVDRQVTGGALDIRIS